MASAVEVKYSIEELNDFVKRSETCVTLERKSRVLYMNPAQFCNLKSGIRECLDVLLLKYDFFFKAIVLGYRKVKLLSRYGSFCYRSSKVSVQIEADFYLFNPVIGGKLQGVVCKRSGHHLGCLVHKAFNVFIPLNQNTYETGWDFAIGQELEFEVVSLDLTTGPLPYIKGQLEKEEKEGDKDDDEGSLVGVEGRSSFAHDWGGSDSGVASSPGRETEESEDMEKDSSSESLTEKSCKEDWMPKKPSKRKLKTKFGDELGKGFTKETSSEDESGMSKSFEIDNASLLGEIKETRNAAQELASEILLSSQTPKKRKGILKNKKEDFLLKDEETKELEGDLGTKDAVEGVKSVFTNEESTSSSKAVKKRKSILKNIMGDLSPKRLETEAIKSILETVDSINSEKSAGEESIGSPKAVKKRKSILKNKEPSLSPKAEEMKVDEEKKEDESNPVNGESSGIPKLIKRRKSVSKTPKKNPAPGSEDMIQMLLKSMEKSFEEKADVPDEEGKAEGITLLTSKMLSGEGELRTNEAKQEVSENAVESSPKKVKRKSISKNKKDTPSLYEALAEKIQKTMEVSPEDNVEASKKEGLENASIVSPRKLETKDDKQNTVSASINESSPKKVKRKSILKSKKDSPPENEDLIKKLLKTMEISFEEKDVEASENIGMKGNVEASPSRNITVESKTEKEHKAKHIVPENTGEISPKKIAGKRKSISRKKDDIPSNVEDIFRRLTETMQIPVVMPELSAKEGYKDEQKTITAQPNKSPVKIKSRHSLDNSSKGSTKKKSRKSTCNLLPLLEEYQTTTTEKPLVKDVESSMSVTSAKEESGNELKETYLLDGTMSTGRSPNKKRESLGEGKTKKRKSTSIVTPEAEKTEAESQIEKLLLLNKKLLGLDSVAFSKKQGDKLSDEEKKIKKRKRESNGVKESPKKRKVAESGDVETPNVGGAQSNYQE